MACKPKKEIPIDQGCPEDSVSFEEFYPFIAGAVNGATTSMMDAYIRNAVHRFLVKTKIVEEVVQLDLQAGVTDYYFNLPECWFVIDIKELKICDCCYTPGDITLCHPQDRKYSYDGTKLEISPIPEHDITDAITVRVSVAPSLGQCFIPRQVFDRYAYVISDMVLGEMLKMKGMDWYDANLAKDHMQSWSNELNEVQAAKVMRGGKLRWRGRAW